MDELTLSERRRGLEFTNRITRLAQDAPDELTERALHAVANKLRRHYGWTKRLKKSHVIKMATENGGITVSEIVARTSWGKSSTFEIVKELCGEGRIKMEQVSPAGVKGGRPVATVFTI